MEGEAAPQPSGVPPARTGPSRQVLVAGALLLAAAVAQPVLAAFVDGRWALGLLATMAAEVVVGREAAIPLAVAQGVPPAWIALTSILQNLAMAALAVPLVVAGLGRLAQHPLVVRRSVALEALARRQQARGRTAWALFAFMLVPFLANGAVIAGLIGAWARIPMRALVLAVVAGVVVTATAWSFGYAALAAALAKVHPALAQVPSWLALLVVAFTIGRLLWQAAARPQHQDTEAR